MIMGRVEIVPILVAFSKAKECKLKKSSSYKVYKSNKT